MSMEGVKYRDNNVLATKVLSALLKNKKPIVVLEGSTRSSKTYSILQYLILEALNNPNIINRTFRFDQATCRKGCVKDFIDIMKSQFPGYWDPTRWNKTDGIYTFGNGSIHAFDGCEEQKLHGVKQHNSHENEVMEIPYKAHMQISQRTKNAEFMDFNPSLTDHWVFDRIMPGIDTGEVFYLHSTYKDNRFCTPKEISVIESTEPTPENIKLGTANEWHWQVYGLGKRGRRQGGVYSRWRMNENFPDRYACQRWGYGLDFGFSVDPTALIECAMFQDQIYVRELLYEKGYTAIQSETNPNYESIEGALKELDIDRTAKIWADNARPESVTELQRVGFNVQEVSGQKKRILPGIDRLQRFMINVTFTSPNIRKELENYTWREDVRTGRLMQDPIDNFNHALDAIRYWAMEELDPERRDMILRKPRPQYAETAYNPFTYN